MLVRHLQSVGYWVSLLYDLSMTPYRCSPHEWPGSSRQTGLVAATSQSFRFVRSLATRFQARQPHLLMHLSAQVNGRETHVHAGRWHAGHCLRLCVRDNCHGARTSPHSATFLDAFVAGSHAIVSTHSSRTADFLFAVEEQSPNKLTMHYPTKKNQHCLDTWANLPGFFVRWNLMTSTDLTAAWTLDPSRSTNSHHLLLLWETEGHFWSPC